MIQANEFRVGNWVWYDGMGGACYVKINELKLSQNINGCDGIPLTPELLEKCGFQNTRANEWSDLHSRAATLIKSTPNANYWDYMIIGERNGAYVLTQGEDYPLSRPIKYLHELQNLAHIIGGYELEINL